MKLGSIFKKILKVLVISYLSATVSACFDCGWEFLFEDLLSDVCPIFESATSAIKDLFLFSSTGKYFTAYFIICMYI